MTLPLYLSWKGLALRFIVPPICVACIADGPVGFVFFHEKDIREHVVEHGLTTKEIIMNIIHQYT